MYYGFADSYKMITSTLYAFDYPRGIIAFQFRNETEAKIVAMKIHSQSPKMEEYEEIRKKKIEEAKKKKEENSTWGKLKGFFHKDD